MATKSSKVTSPKVATVASKELSNKATPKPVKSVAASAVSQAGGAKKATKKK